MFKTGGNQSQEEEDQIMKSTEVQNNYFVKFEHTKFSEQNKKAMALLRSKFLIL